MRTRLSLTFAAALALGIPAAAGAQAVSPYLFGQNYWMEQGSDGGRPGYLHLLWPRVTESGVRLVRTGGNGYEHSFPDEKSYLHVDFFQVDLTQKITVSVPIHFVGKARGVEFGGILDHPLRELEVECLPRAIPEHIEVDVSALQVGQSVHVSELVLPEGVEVKTDAGLPVASVVLPAAEVEATPTETVVEGEAVGDAAAAAPAEAAPAEGGKAEGGKGGKGD